MATLTVNNTKLRVFGRSSWAFARPGRYGYIEAVVDVSTILVASLNVATATVKLEAEGRAIEGRDMLQVASMVTNGSVVRLEYRGADVWVTT